MKVAIIDDQEEIRYSVSRILKKAKHKTFVFDGLEENIAEIVISENIDLLLIDIMLSEDFSGIDLIKNLREKDIKQPAILMTAYTTPTNMIEASKIGVKDILQKPFTSDELNSIVKKYDVVESENITISKQIDEEFVGSFETMKEIYSKIGIAANNNLPVIILGDTGTGKELIANLIHKNSRHNDSPILAINCASIPKELFESQLFGHERGAFTDAKTQHIGFAESIGEGTLFLDEIGELDLTLQSKLLRFLESKVFRRIGGNSDISFKGRIVSATNINIDKNIKNDSFREDLFYRLSMISIEVPSLQKRKQDIPILVEHFIKKANKDLKLSIKGISNEALEILKQREYKGNIRELRNIVYNCVLDARESVIHKENIKILSENCKEVDITVIISDLIDKREIENSKEVLEELEKSFYTVLLTKTDNITHLANYLDISRSTLRKILKKYDLI